MTTVRSEVVRFLLPLLTEELGMLERLVVLQNLVAILGVLFCSQASDGAEPQIAALSELSIEELSEVKITSIATGTDKLISEAPAIASVITSEEILQMGATTFEEALESVPGLHVSRSAASGGYKYLIRGIATIFNPQVLVMINGIPISSMLRGDRNSRLGVLPIKLISRIEVIRGPGSARYGADAFAGVINVITKKPSDLKGSEVGGQVGSFHTYETWYLHGAESEDLKWSFMFDYRQSQGPEREVSADAQTGLDNALGTNASLAPGPVNFSEKGIAIGAEVEKKKWRFRGFHFTAYDLGTGYGTAGALDPVGKTKRTRTTVDLTYHDSTIAKNWDLTSQIALHQGAQEFTDYLQLFPPGANLGRGPFPNGVLGRPEYFERQYRLDNTALYTGIESHRLQFGVGFALQDLYKVQDSVNFNPNFSPRPDLVDLTDTAEISLPEKNRHSYYIFAQDEWNVATDWELTLGVRLDRYSDFGNTLNPRAALVWGTTEKLTTKFLYGRAFRAPAFGELYTINNPIALGNPDIGPETIDVYELGWTYKSSENMETSFNIFHYDIKDLITFVPSAGGTSIAQNSSQQNGNGFELETTVKATSTVYWTANYAFVDSKDKASGKPSGNYPNDRVYFRSDWAFAENWNWDTQIHWVGRRHREPTDTRNPLKGYTSVDLTLRRVFVPEKFSVTGAVKNIFDEDIREPSPGPGPIAARASVPNDFPQAGRSAVIELTYQF